MAKFWIAVVSILIAGLVPFAAPVSAQEGSEYVPFPETQLGGTYFVTQQYRDLLAREPDAEGLAFWTAKLTNGLAPQLMVEAFVDSPEFAGSREPIARLYLAGFGRLPDDAGWRYWTDQFTAGASLESIAAEFVASPEGTERFGATDAGFIDQLYQNALGRPADDEGSSYWQKQFSDGVAKSAMLVLFSDSVEFRNRSAPEIRASLLYTGLLDRTPEEQGLRYWSDQLKAGAAFSSAVSGFLDSPEYRARLRSNWCRVVEPSEITLFDGPSPPDFNDAYARMQANGDAIGLGLPSGPFDELGGYALDPFPDYQFLVTVQRDRVAPVCLEVLRSAPHPEQVTFRASPWFNSDLDEVAEALRSGVGPDGVLGYGRGGGVGLNIDFSSEALPGIDAFLAQFGERVSEVMVGSFPYPMPSPLPESRCRPVPADEVTAIDLGLEITVDLPSEPAPAGREIVGTFTVTNQSDKTYTLYWGFEVTAYLGSGGPSVSAFNGFRKLPLTISVLEPGESTVVPLGVGTDACDPAVGHRLPAGTYEMWGHVSVFGGSDPGADALGSDALPLRLPATQLTLSN